MSRTRTKPLDDRGMWRKALAKTHPHAGGDHDLFIWMQEARDAMCNGDAKQAVTPPPRPEPRMKEEPDRVPFPETADFGELTAKALNMAAQNPGDPIARLLLLLDDCVSLPRLHREESCGATYKQCSYAARLVGLSYGQRQEWYWVCEAIPLSQRHLGHLIKQLKRKWAE